MKKFKKQNDKFELYDLGIEVIKGHGKFVCSHKIGDYFEVVGENLVFKKGCKIFFVCTFCITATIACKAEGNSS